MNEDEIVELGVLCQALLTSDHFNTIIAHYKQTLACDILTTKPNERDKREQIYASLGGIDGLLSYMRLNAETADKITNPEPATTDDDLRGIEEDLDY